MKYGLLYWRETNNVGDDIQAYASMQFLPQIDYLIDREMPNALETPGHEPVAVIMNGWLLYNTFNWPPSNDLYPLCISMHLVNTTETDYLNGLGGDYLRVYGPVGCRDEYTLNMLKAKGIEAYFSGCMTLTLPKQPLVQPKRKYICLVDVTPSVERKTRNIARQHGLEVITTCHAVKDNLVDIPWSKRVAIVEHLLGLYQNASCVLTSRLHCALPCLAMEVPVLLTHTGNINKRFGPFLPMLHVAHENEFINGTVQYDISNPPANKDTYKDTRINLVAQVKSFIQKTEEFTANEPRRFAPTAETRIRWQTALIQNRLGDLYAKPRDALKKFVDSRGVKPTLFLLFHSAVHLPVAIWQSFRKNT